MKVEDIRRVLIVGAGTMGQQIGFQCAMHGFDVVLYDISPDILDKAKDRINKLCENFVLSGRMTREQSDEAVARIAATTNPLEAARDVDILSESVPEAPELKGKVLSQFNEVCPARTIFTTNTSMLVPSMFAEATGRPEKFAALHFHDVRITNVVDIMPHPGTSKDTVDLIHAFARKIGQVAIVLHKEHHGYVFNNMLSSLLSAALSLAANDVASIEDIDRAWMGIMHTESGPFGIMDSIGLKTIWAITDYWANKKSDPQARANAAFVKKYVEKGLLGEKTRQGFYSYPEPSYRRPGFLGGDERK
ncbi:MAG: 3-hydroxyacyl-CoA dehydrogenase [Deltaproteobacteria bacterium]|nr:3-hydroxyacyl-CoA dehydrogenase [Deltaproteobacteria bacterium]